MKYQRIEDMRIDQDLTIKEISALLECNRDVYSRYEKGIRDIPIDYVIRLARFYDCSVDYLLSVSSKKEKIRRLIFLLLSFFIFVFFVLIRPFGRILYYNGILILRQF